MNAPAHLAHFEHLYRNDADPWRVRDSWYEQRKRAVLLASLPQQRYRNAFEPGCGNGELSAELALRCDRLLAADAAPAAVALARARVAAHPHVQVDHLTLPDDWPQPAPAERFDLIVISELAYYFDGATVLRLAQGAAAALAPGGTLLLCHWCQDFDDRLQPTRLVHDAFGSQPGLQHELRHEEQAFLLDVWLRSADLAEVQP